MNGDGRPDLVVANLGDGTVSVMLGNDAGGFGPKTDYATGISPVSVAIGDVNADGKPDLAVANYDGNTISVYLGNGAGGFAPKTDLVTGLNPNWVAIADVSGDGKPDLVVANYSANTLSVLPGNGAGGFGAKTDFATGLTPYVVAVGDVNGDGKPDLVSANWTSGSVSVLLGNGLGGFGAKTDFATGLHPDCVAIGDVNGDGKPDLVVTNGLSNSVTLLLGNGAGGFGSRTDFPTPAGPYFVQIADVNGDGRPDLAVANFDANNVSLLLGDGAGGFGPRTDIATGIGPTWVGVRDVNGDGRADLVVPNSGSNTASVLLGLVPTRTTLAASPSPALLGMPLLLTATLAVPAPGSGAPTGTVSFFDGTTLLGTSPVSGTAAGLALFAPYLGTRSLNAVYSGDGRMLGSISASQVERVVSTSAATLTSVADVPHDQGKQVRLTFAASPFDYAGSATAIVRYDVFRQIVPGAAPATAAPAVHAGPEAATVVGWDNVGSANAYGDVSYSIVVPTVLDSNGTGIHRATFFVRAATAVPATYFDSAPDSGYSVDNIPPLPPTPFTAAYAGGATYLHWGPNTEPDLWYYRLYRGTSAGFVPGPANLIATRNDTGYVDVGPATGYYKLSAVDVNGNESAFSALAPTAILGVNGGALPRELALAAPRPNPARGQAVLSFGLPRSAVVTLAVYDMQGRRVRVVSAAPMEAGAYDLPFDLRDDRGRPLANGLYFVRLDAGGRRLVTRLAVVE